MSTVTITIWEGRRGPAKMLRRGSRRSRRTSIELRRKKVFTGELVGFWRDGCFARQRGREYWIFLSEDGEVIVHRVRCSTRTTADDVGTIFHFPDLDAATEKFGDILKKAGVI